MSFMDVLFFTGLLILMSTWECNPNDRNIKFHKPRVKKVTCFRFSWKFELPWMRTRHWLGKKKGGNSFGWVHVQSIWYIQTFDWMWFQRQVSRFKVTNSPMRLTYAVVMNSHLFWWDALFAYIIDGYFYMNGISNIWKKAKLTLTEQSRLKPSFLLEPSSKTDISFFWSDKSFSTSYHTERIIGIVVLISSSRFYQPHL